MTVKLKKRIVTKFASVVFPADVEMKAKRDEYGVLVQHPTREVLHVRANENNLIIISE
jgi:hypothetical protein